MNVNEAGDKYFDCESVVIIVEKKGKVYALAVRNFNSGQCDCCSDSDIDRMDEVSRVVDMSSMETLYMRGK